MPEFTIYKRTTVVESVEIDAPTLEEALAEASEYADEFDWDFIQEDSTIEAEENN